MTPRYALYYAPESGSSLARFGNAVLGRDAEKDCEVAFHPDLFDEPGWNELTAEPRHYGLHATVKAPFELTASATEGDLVAAVAAFAVRRRPFTLPLLDVARLQSFIALVPHGESAEINDLADSCVRVFDRFRAPLSEQDRRRRLRAPLSERQRDQLENFGYPYIFRDFRFHITLTGPLCTSQSGRVLDVLARLYAPLREAVPFTDIALYRQPDRATPFCLLRRFRFGA